LSTLFISKTQLKGKVRRKTPFIFFEAVNNNPALYLAIGYITITIKVVKKAG